MKFHELLRSSQDYFHDICKLRFVSLPISKDSKDSFNMLEPTQMILSTASLSPVLHRPPRTRTTICGPSIGPLVLMDGERMYPKFSSISWADLDRGPRFFLVSGRRWTRFLSGPSTSWTDSDAGPGLSFLRWTSGRMDSPTHGRIRTADPDYDI